MTIREEEIRGLMEAYSKVHGTCEVLNDEEIFENWIYSFVEEGYDLSDFDWNSEYDEYIDEALGSEFVQRGGIGGAIQRAQARAKQDGGASNRAWLGNKVKGFFDAQSRFVQRGGVQGAIQRAQSRAKKDGGASNRAWLARQIGLGGDKKGGSDSSTTSTKSKFAGARDTAFAKASKIKGSPVVGSKPAEKSSPSTSTPTAAAKPTPAGGSVPKPAKTPAAKPAGSAMDQWAKANPKLAAAKAERDRTRGTSATTNPLMKDMKSSMPAPKSPSPETAKTAFNLSKKGVNLSAGVDIFDLVKGHLLDEGYADSEEGAMVIMVNMSEEWRKSILESHGVELDEASYSAKAARAGEDIGKPGKMFGKIAKEAGKRYGSEERGKKVAGAVLAKLRKEEVEEIDEAQRARENPEDHDKEEKKKYEPVRGERTPMPPRGDKRREDFEKWYAKHVR